MPKIQNLRSGLFGKERENKMVGWNGTMAEADRVGFTPEQSGMLGRLGMTMREYTLDEVAKTYATKDDLHGQFVSGVFAGMAACAAVVMAASLIFITWF